MTQINPFLGAVAQGTQVQQRHSAEKERQIRRVQNLGKNAALQGDRLEHQVESADAVGAIDAHDSTPNLRKKPSRRKARPQEADGEDKPHIDLKA